MLSERDARRIYFFRALHDVDQERQIMGPVNAPREGDGDDTERLNTYFKEMEATLESRFKLSFLSFYRRRSTEIAPWLLVICFLLGLTSNYFGDSRTVNILLNPLIGLFVWNLVIYALLPLGFMKGKRDAYGQRMAKLSPFMAGLAARLRSLGSNHTPNTRGMLISARLRYLQEWVRDYRELTVARLSALFHMGACVLVVGVITGLYVRAFTENYSFEWRSTFVQDLESAQTILGVIFAPIALLGSPWFPDGVPDLSDSAAWVHFLALAGLGYVVMPRFLLSFYQRHKARRLERNLSLDTEQVYFRKLLAAGGGSHRQLLPVFYSCRLEDARYQELMAAIRIQWGSRIKEEARVSVNWGETEAEMILPEFGKLVLLLVFNGAQTPEDDVHGRYCEDLISRLEARDAPSAVLALVDAAAVDEEARKRRKSAWGGVLAEAGMGFLWLDSQLEENNDALVQGMSDTVRRLP
jgi:hypothetical protein